MTLQGLVNQAYPSPEWVVFFEVSNATGFQSKRRADAVALGVWPSRGHALIGFEFKEDRRDWLREKNDPAKADVIAAHCDSWYVVAGSKTIVNVDELPEPWGLYVANDDRTRLQCVKTCTPFPDRDKSTIKRHFAAAMLRKVGETTVPRMELNRIVEERVKEAVDRTSSGHELKWAQKRVEQLEGILETFKAETGVDLRDWRGPKALSKAVQAILIGDTDRSRLEHAAKALDDAARTLREAAEAWPLPKIERAS